MSNINRVHQRLIVPKVQAFHLTVGKSTPIGEPRHRQYGYARILRDAAFSLGWHTSEYTLTTSGSDYAGTQAGYSTDLTATHSNSDTLIIKEV